MSVMYMFGEKLDKTSKDKQQSYLISLFGAVSKE